MRRSRKARRAFYLTTAALTPLMLTTPTPVTAGCTVSANSLDCSGDLTEGIAHFGTEEFLNVHDFTTHIAPVLGVSGIRYKPVSQNFGVRHVNLNVDTARYRIITDGAAGISTTGINGDVSVQFTGNVETTGERAPGLKASTRQGDISVSGSGSISTSGDNSDGISADAAQTDAILIPILPDGTMLWPNRLKDGIEVEFSGDISTAGENSNGIRATSSTYGGYIAGSKVIFDGRITTTGDKSHGILTSALDVDIDIGGEVFAAGMDSSAVLVNQSHSIYSTLNESHSDVNTSFSLSLPLLSVFNQEIHINISDSGILQGGSGNGAGINIDAGFVGPHLLFPPEAVVTNYGDISALSGMAIRGRAESDVISNYGTITGSVDLGAGYNRITNNEGGTFYMGETVYLGTRFDHPFDASVNYLSNRGTISPGEQNEIATTVITGKFIQEDVATITNIQTGEVTQAGAGTYVVDLDQSTATADLIEVIGSATIAGTVLPNLLSTADASGQVDILTATGGVTDNGVAVNDTAVADYTLLFPDANTMALGYVIDFTPFPDQQDPSSPLTPNNFRIGEYFNSLFAGGPGELQPLVSALLAIPGMGSFKDALDQLTPDAYLGNAAAGMDAAVSFARDAMSCERHINRTNRNADGMYRNGSCAWAEFFGQRREYDQTRYHIGYTDKSWGLRGGAEFAIGEAFSAGLAASFEDVSTRTGNPAESEGSRINFAATGKTSLGIFDAALMIHGGFAQHDVSRPVMIPGFEATSKGEQDVSYIGGRAEFSAPFDLGLELSLRPILGLGVINVGSDEVNESEGLSSLRVSRFEKTIFYANPALELTGDIHLENGARLAPSARLGVLINSSRNFSAASCMAGAPDGLAPFSTQLRHDAVFGEFAAGLDALITPLVSIGAHYEGAVSAHSQSHKGDLRVSIGF